MGLGRQGLNDAAEEAQEAGIEQNWARLTGLSLSTFVGASIRDAYRFR